MMSSVAPTPPAPTSKPTAVVVAGAASANSAGTSTMTSIRAPAPAGPSPTSKNQVIRTLDTPPASSGSGSDTRVSSAASTLLMLSDEEIGPRRYATGANWPRIEPDAQQQQGQQPRTRAGSPPAQGPTQPPPEPELIRQRQEQQPQSQSHQQSPPGFHSTSADGPYAHSSALANGNGNISPEYHTGYSHAHQHALAPPTSTSSASAWSSHPTGHPHAYPNINSEPVVQYIPPPVTTAHGGGYSHNINDPSQGPPMGQHHQQGPSASPYYEYGSQYPPAHYSYHMLPYQGPPGMSPMYPPLPDGHHGYHDPHLSQHQQQNEYDYQQFYPRIQAHTHMPPPPSATSMDQQQQQQAHVHAHPYPHAHPFQPYPYGGGYGVVTPPSVVSGVPAPAHVSRRSSRELIPFLENTGINLTDTERWRPSVILEPGMGPVDLSSGQRMMQQQMFSRGPIPMIPFKQDKEVQTMDSYPPVLPVTIKWLAGPPPPEQNAAPSNSAQEQQPVVGESLCERVKRRKSINGDTPSVIKAREPEPEPAQSQSQQSQEGPAVSPTGPSGNPLEWPCQRCDRMCISRNKLLQHMKYAHPAAKKSPPYPQLAPGGETIIGTGNNAAGPASGVVFAGTSTEPVANNHNQNGPIPMNEMETETEPDTEAAETEPEVEIEVVEVEASKTPSTPGLNVSVDESATSTSAQPRNASVSPEYSHLTNPRHQPRVLLQKVSVTPPKATTTPETTAPSQSPSPNTEELDKRGRAARHRRRSKSLAPYYPTAEEFASTSTPKSGADEVDEVTTRRRGRSRTRRTSRDPHRVATRSVSRESNSTPNRQSARSRSTSRASTSPSDRRSTPVAVIAPVNRSRTRSQSRAAGDTPRARKRSKSLADRPQTCALCGARASKMSNLRRHYKNSHPNAEAPTIESLYMSADAGSDSDDNEPGPTDPRLRSRARTRSPSQERQEPTRPGSTSKGPAKSRSTSQQPPSKSRSRSVSRQRRRQSMSSSAYTCACELCGRLFESPDELPDHLLEEHGQVQAQLAGSGFYFRPIVEAYARAAVGAVKHPNGGALDDSNTSSENMEMPVLAPAVPAPILHPPPPQELRKSMDMDMDSAAATSASEYNGGEDEDMDVEILEEIPPPEPTEPPLLKREGVVDDGLVPCPICIVRFPPEEVVEHKYSHTLECYTCGRGDVPVSEMVAHGTSHIAALECEMDECNYKSTKKSRIWEHHNRMHANLKPVICMECGDGFFSRETMRGHYDRWHLGKKESYPCGRCDARFDTKRQREAHELSGHHQNLKRSTTPQNLKRSTTPTPQNLKRSTTPQNLKRSTTPQNLKRSTTPQTLKRGHGDVGDMNNNNNARKRHQSAPALPKAPASGSKPSPTVNENACILCKKIFSSARCVTRHLFHVHGVTQKPKPKPDAATPEGTPNVNGNNKSRSRSRSNVRFPVPDKTKAIPNGHVPQEKKWSEPIDIGEDELACPVCAKVFTATRNVRRHVRDVHKLKVLDPTPSRSVTPARITTPASSRSATPAQMTTQAPSRPATPTPSRSATPARMTTPIRIRLAGPGNSTAAIINGNDESASASTNATGSGSNDNENVDAGNSTPAMPTPNSRPNSPKTCDVCLKKLSSQRSLDRHLVLIHNRKIANYAAIIKGNQMSRTTWKKAPASAKRRQARLQRQREAAIALALAKEAEAGRGGAAAAVTPAPASAAPAAEEGRERGPQENQNEPTATAPNGGAVEDMDVDMDMEPVAAQ